MNEQMKWPGGCERRYLEGREAHLEDVLRRYRSNRHHPFWMSEHFVTSSHTYRSSDWPEPFALGVVTLLSASELSFTFPGKPSVQFQVTAEKLRICA